MAQGRHCEEVYINMCSSQYVVTATSLCLLMCLYLLTMSGDKLRISTFNCKNAKSSVDELLMLCDVSDIVFLQETWLSNDELVFLKNLHGDFLADGVSSLNDNQLNVGRPHGGIAILWSKQ